MSKRLPTLVFWLVAAVLAVYFIGSMFPSILFSNEIEIKPAERTSYNDYLTVTGIALRDEQVFSFGNYPWVSYELANGERAAVGQKVISCSGRELSVTDRLTVDTLDRQIALLEESIRNTSQYDIVTLDNQTREAIENYLGQLDGNSLLHTQKMADAVQVSFIKKDIRASGNSSYYSSVLSQLQATRTAILSEGGHKEESVYTTSAGYFSSNCDGYESVRYSDYGKITVSSLQALLSGGVPDTIEKNAYKLQQYSYWGFACLMDAEDAAGFSSGATFAAEVDVAGFGTQSLTFVVQYVSPEENGQCAVMFQCSFMNEAVYTLRIASVRIIRKTYNGFQIPLSALRMEEEQTGVYVLSGVKLVFKPVRVLFSNDAIAVVVADSASRGLAANDRIVIAGQDIYDGKIININ